MNNNVRIAKELVRVAKAIVAESEFEDFLKTLGFEIKPDGEASIEKDGFTIIYSTHRDPKQNGKAQSPTIVNESGEDELYTGRATTSSGERVPRTIQEVYNKVKDYEERQSSNQA